MAGPDTVMSVIYRCAMKLHPADRLAIGDGLHGGICLRCAAFLQGLSEPIDAGTRTRFGSDIGIAARLSSRIARPLEHAPGANTRLILR